MPQEAARPDPPLARSVAPDQPRLRILMLPPQPWEPARRAFRPGAAPDPGALDRELAGQGITLTLIDPGGPPGNPLAGRHALLGGIDPLRALRVMIRERNCDAVLACFESPTLLLLLLRRLFGFRPAVAMVDVALSGGWRLRDWMLDRVIPRIDGIIVLGANQIDHIHAHWRTAALVVFVHQHVDVDFYQPAPFQPDGPVLSVGDDVGRDFPTLLAATEGMQRDLVIKSAMIPAGDAGRPRLRVIPGRLPEPAYRQLFADARFVVVPLSACVHASGVGTILEAMAMGRALIVSDSPGIRDYVSDDRTALVVPCGDAGALRAAIQRLAREPDTCRRLGEAARAFVVANCAYRVHAERTAEALRRIIAHRLRPG